MGCRVLSTMAFLAMERTLGIVGRAVAVCEKIGKRGRREQVQPRECRGPLLWMGTNIGSRMSYINPPARVRAGGIGTALLGRSEAGAGVALWKPSREGPQYPPRLGPRLDTGFGPGPTGAGPKAGGARRGSHAARVIVGGRD